MHNYIHAYMHVYVHAYMDVHVLIIIIIILYVTHVHVHIRIPYIPSLNSSAALRTILSLKLAPLPLPPEATPPSSPLLRTVLR